MDNLHDNHNTYRGMVPEPVKPDWMTDDEWCELQHIGAFNFYD